MSDERPAVKVRRVTFQVAYYHPSELASEDEETEEEPSLTPKAQSEGSQQSSEIPLGS
jgi:hypothetical protein